MYKKEHKEKKVNLFIKKRNKKNSNIKIIGNNMMNIDRRLKKNFVVTKLIYSTLNQLESKEDRRFVVFYIFDVFPFYRGNNGA